MPDPQACGDAASRLASALAANGFSPHGAVLAPIGDGRGLEFRAAWGPAAAELLQNLVRVPLRSIAGRALKRKQGVYINNAQTSREHFHITDRLTGVGTRRLFALPIRTGRVGGRETLVLELMQPKRNIELSQVLDVVLQHGFRPVGWGPDSLSTGIRSTSRYSA